MLKLKDLSLLESRRELSLLPEGKVLINTINAHSYNTAQKDPLFAEALQKGDALVPDGASIVMACRWLKAKSQPKERIAGWDLFEHEMEQLNRRGGKCFFMGSSERVLGLVKAKAAKVYPNITVETYSPPYKPEFSDEENRQMEKWVYTHWKELDIHCHCGAIGAVFDFFAGTVERAPKWWQEHSLEWLYRLIREPRRMWRRYIIGNMLFLINIAKEKF